MNQSESWNSCGHVVMAGFQTIHVIPYEGRMFFFCFLFASLIRSLYKIVAIL